MNFISPNMAAQYNIEGKIDNIQVIQIQSYTEKIQA